VQEIDVPSTSSENQDLPDPRRGHSNQERGQSIGTRTWDSDKVEAMRHEKRRPGTLHCLSSRGSGQENITIFRFSRWPPSAMLDFHFFLIFGRPSHWEA